MIKPTAPRAVEELLFAPFAPGFTDDPYPHYARLRERAPVFRHPLGFYMITGYRDVSTLLEADQVVEDFDGAPWRDRDLSDRRFGGPAESALHRNPSAHEHMRRLVTSAFTPRSIAELENRITQLVDKMLDDIADAGQVDLMQALARPLPLAVITEIIGIPPTDAEPVRELADVLARCAEPASSPETAAEIAAAFEHIDAIVCDVFEWKRRSTADDLMTALAQGGRGHEQLTEEDVVSLIVLLYVSSHETALNLIGSGTLTLLNNPDQLARLRGERDLTANAVEEMVRYEPSVQLERRVTLLPLQVGDNQIEEGAFVFLNLASANRDRSFWGDDADEFKVDRPNARRHLSFGVEPRHRLGAALARTEARIAIDRLIRRFPKLTLDGDAKWNGRVSARGLSAFPVSV